MQFESSFICLVATILLSYNEAAPTSYGEVPRDMELTSEVNNHKIVKKELKIPDALKRVKRISSQDDNDNLNYLRSPSRKILKQDGVGENKKQVDVSHKKSNEIVGPNFESTAARSDQEMNYKKPSDKKMQIKGPSLIRSRKRRMNKPGALVRNLNAGKFKALNGDFNLKSPLALKAFNPPEALRPKASMKNIETLPNPKKKSTRTKRAKSKPIEYSIPNNQFDLKPEIATKIADEKLAKPERRRKSTKSKKGFKESANSAKIEKTSKEQIESTGSLKENAHPTMYKKETGKAEKPFNTENQITNRTQVGKEAAIQAIIEKETLNPIEYKKGAKEDVKSAETKNKIEELIESKHDTTGPIGVSEKLADPISTLKTKKENKQPIEFKKIASKSPKLEKETVTSLEPEKEINPNKPHGYHPISNLDSEFTFFQPLYKY